MVNHYPLSCLGWTSEVNALLIALNQWVQLTQLKVVADPEVSAAIDEIQAITEQTIYALCRLARALCPLYLEDLGLVAALVMLVREPAQTAGFPVGFQRAGTERRLPPEVELALYCMAQDGLSNVVRHAQAEHASLSVHFAPQSVTLTVPTTGAALKFPKAQPSLLPVVTLGCWVCMSGLS